MFDLGLIFIATKKIEQTVKTVHANKRQCLLLNERVQRISSILSTHGFKFKQERYAEPLRHTHQLFCECDALITLFSESSWKLQVWKNRSHKEKFSYLHLRLRYAIEELQLGISAAAFDILSEQEAEGGDAQELEGKILPTLKDIKGGIEGLDIGIADLHAGHESIQGDMKVIKQMISQLAVTRVVPAASTAEGNYQQGYQADERKDYLNAAAFYQLAISLGHTKAKTNMATLYRRGLAGLAVDECKAYTLCLAAANEGHARAMYNVGNFKEYGIGTLPNLEEAKVWYDKALKTGQLGGKLASMADTRFKRVLEKLAQGLK